MRQMGAHSVSARRGGQRSGDPHYRPEWVQGDVGVGGRVRREGRSPGCVLGSLQESLVDQVMMELRSHTLQTCWSSLFLMTVERSHSQSHSVWNVRSNLGINHLTAAGKHLNRSRRERGLHHTLNNVLHFRRSLAAHNG